MRKGLGIFFVISGVCLLIVTATGAQNFLVGAIFDLVVGCLLIRSARKRKEEEEEKKNFDR